MAVARLERVDLAGRDGRELRLAHEQPLVGGLSERAGAVDDVRLHGGEADHHEGHEHQRGAGEAGAHLAAMHVVESEHERRGHHARLVALDVLHAALGLPQRVDVLLELRGEQHRRRAGDEDDHEAQQDHHRGTHDLEGGMEQPQQAEDDEEDARLREELLADVREAEHQLLEEEHEGHEQRHVPENAPDGVGDRLVDDRVVEDQVRQRLAEAAPPLHRRPPLRGGRGVRLGRARLEVQRHLVRHAEAPLQHQALLGKFKHRGGRLGPDVAQQRRVLRQIAGAGDLAFPIRLEARLVRLRRAEAERPDRRDQFVFRRPRAQGHEEALVGFDELHHPRRVLVRAFRLEFREPARRDEARAREVPERLWIHGVEDRDRRGAIEDQVVGRVEERLRGLVDELRGAAQVLDVGHEPPGAKVKGIDRLRTRPDVLRIDQMARGEAAVGVREEPGLLRGDDERALHGKVRHDRVAHGGGEDIALDRVRLLDRQSLERPLPARRRPDGLAQEAHRRRDGGQIARRDALVRQIADVGVGVHRVDDREGRVRKSRPRRRR